MARTTHIALLRGINVGRNKRIAMADLRDMLTELGFTDVKTLLQSGNAVFRDATEGATKADARADAALAERLEDAIEKRFAMSVSVVVRSREELADAVEHNPLAEYTDDGARFLVTFLADKPRKGAFDGLEPPADSGEKFAVRGREIYLFMPHGFQGAHLSNEFWEKRVGTKATTRNWNTVTKLLAMASDQAASD